MNYFSVKHNSQILSRKLYYFAPIQPFFQKEGDKKRVRSHFYNRLNGKMQKTGPEKWGLASFIALIY